MQITQTKFSPVGIKFILTDNNKQIGRVFLYILKNDLHQHPFGFMEDLFLEEEFRSKGNGQKLVQAVMEEAKKQGCYKLIGTSRYEREKVHDFYKKLGFKDYGKEFRLDL